MYKHILVPTDGSALSEIAVREGVAFAKSINAKVTALTVSSTFQTFSIDPLTVTDTPEQYRKECDARAEKYLGMVNDAAEAAGLSFAGRPRPTSTIFATKRSSIPPTGRAAT